MQSFDLKFRHLNLLHSLKKALGDEEFKACLDSFLPNVQVLKSLSLRNGEPTSPLKIMKSSPAKKQLKSM